MKRVSGVLAPVITPFREDLSPDPALFVQHCQWICGQGAGLAVFGTNSEANSLATEEKLELLDQLVAAGTDPALMMPGTGACALSDSVRLSARAVSLGCAGVLMLPPFYYKAVPDEGLFAFYAEVIERVASERLQIYLYHIPPVSQVPISLALIERLASRYPDNIAGIKDSSGDWQFTQSLNALGIPDFQVFCGSESFLLQNMQAGGAGCISATANVNPAAIVTLYSSWQAPDAEQQQADLNRVRALFQEFPMISALKAATAQHSGHASWTRVRPPLTALGTDQAEALRTRLEAEGFAMPGL